MHKKLTALSLALATACEVLDAAAGLQQQRSSDPSSRREFLDQASASVLAGSTAPLWIPGASNAESGAAASASAIELPPIGLGCWAWGDSLFWGYNPSQDADLEEVFDYAVSRSSPVLIDTAELYGLGRSESLIGDFSKRAARPEDTILATKFAALPFRTKPEAVVKACEASMKRLGRQIDLYQIHFPNAFANEAYWDGLAKAYERGFVKAVGVSNYGVDATRACHAALAKRGIPLATNQIQYSLLYRYPEENGLLQACRDLGVQVLSYSPLALGLLTGKYGPDNVDEVRGPRRALFRKTVGTPEFGNLVASMEAVAREHPGANLPQVAINYARAHRTVPIPGARNLRQVTSNYGSLSWEMSSEEVKFLDGAASKLSYVDPNSSPFPKKDKDTGLIMFDS